jgi:MoaA/NifB/PqqE/SkfB family radical SAM enzyme
VDVFERLVTGKAKARLIYLQGWGEPLLHPDFLTLVQMAKRAGAIVGTTTNGTLVDAPTARRLVECGMDVVAFSLAGVDEQNNVVRKGPRIGQVLDAIGALDDAKRSLGKEVPKIHIAYMLLRSGLENMERLPSLLRERGIDQVVISTLDFVPSRNLENETVIPHTFREYGEIRRRLEALSEEGKRCGLEIRSQIHRPGERRLTCTENVQRALYVASDGTVSPCPFTNLPVSGLVNTHRTDETPYRPLILGNICETALADIWRHKAYRRFRRSFYDGGLPALCEICPKLSVG